MHSRPRWRLFDPELVGSLLRATLAGIAFDDFQDLPAWRALVPVVADHVATHSGDDLVAVQSVLHQQYWREPRAGLAHRDISVVHVLLDADDDTLRERIASDRNEPSAAPWRLDHIHAYRAARPWLLAAADLVVDTTAATEVETATAVLAGLP